MYRLILLGALVFSSTLYAQHLQFQLQPYKGASVSIDGSPAKIRVLKADKVMAMVRVNLPKKTEGLYRVQVSLEAYRPRFIEVEARQLAGFNRQQRLVVLDKVDSKYEFLSAYSTGVAPKSVTFIDDRRIVAPSLGGNGAHVIDITTGQTTVISPPRKWARKKGFVESLVIKEHDELWISQMHTGCIHKFRLSNLEYQATVKLRASWPKVMLYDRVRDAIWVSNWGTMNISMVDRKVLKDKLRIKVYGTPRGLELSKDGSFIYVTQFSGPVANDISGKLVKIDIKRRKIVKRMGIRGAKRHIVSDSGRNLFYTTDMARRTVEAFNQENDKAMNKVKVYSNPNTLVYSKINDRIYVSSRGRNNPKGYTKKGYDFGKISVIDPESFKILEIIKGGNQPTGLDVSPGGRYFVFSDFLDDRIRVYRFLGTGPAIKNTRQKVIQEKVEEEPQIEDQG